jgi:hypothetical protein
MQVHELVARFAAAVETAEPMGAARKVLEATTSRKCSRTSPASAAMHARCSTAHPT